MVRVAILGATGYTALELIKLLLRHPEVEITVLTSRQEGNPHVGTVHPALVGRLDLRLEDLGAVAVAARADCVFSCLPHGVTATIVPQLLATGVKVIDFSADYRLDDPATFRQWYGEEHPDGERLGKSGLRPAGIVSRANRQGAVGGQSWMLSNLGDSTAGGAVKEPA